MNRYDEYKPTGVEWMPEIPSQWQLMRGKDHFKIISGYPFDSKKFNPSTGFPLVRIRDISVAAPSMNFDGEWIPQAAIDSGDILIGMDGDYNIAKWKGGPALLNQRVCCVRSSNTIEKDFLFYLLPVPLQIINDLTYYTTVKHLSVSDLMELRFALPSLEEQQSIIRFLDAKTAQLDQLIAQKQQMLALLREERAALINHAVTKGLDAGAPLRDSGIAWLGELPAHWEVKRLKWIAEIQGGVALSAGKKLENPVTLPYLRVANVQDGYLDLAEVKTVEVEAEQVGRYTLHKGDLLMNEGGDNDKLGRGCVWQGEIAPCLHQNHVFAVRLFDGYDPEWLNLITATEGARVHFQTRAKQSTNLASISSTNIKELPVLLPPLAEQREIMALVAAETARVTEITATVNQEIALLQEYRAALIAEAVTGQIDVRHYEPALEAALM